MGLYKIPDSEQSASQRNFKAILCRTADTATYTEYEVARLMSHFFEHLAFYVSQGRPVSIPAFGRFGGKMYKSKQIGELPRPYPAFSASVGFRNDTLVGCPRNLDLVKPLESHRKRCCVTTVEKGARASQRVITGMEAFRSRLRLSNKHLLD